MAQTWVETLPLLDVCAVHKVVRRHTLITHGGQGPGPKTTQNIPILIPAGGGLKMNRYGSVGAHKRP